MFQLASTIFLEHNTRKLLVFVVGIMNEALHANEDVQALYMAYAWLHSTTTTLGTLVVRHVAKFVVDYLPMPVEIETFYAGRSRAVLFNGKAPNSAVFALRVDFSGDQKC